MSTSVALKYRAETAVAALDVAEAAYGHALRPVLSALERLETENAERARKLAYEIEHQLRDLRRELVNLT